VTDHPGEHHPPTDPPAGRPDPGERRDVPALAESRDVPALTIDARGLRCPAPIIELARRIDEVPVGAVVALLADDEAARLDVPAWCAMRGHEYLGPVGGTSPGSEQYLVRRSR
jgi:cysteine desulfurase